MRVAASAIAGMIAHARRDAPHECCGLLVGDERLIARAVATRNLADTPLTRYLVDPAEHVALMRALRATGESIVGAYHSHPSAPAAPSPTDVAEAWSPDFLYVIVSLSEETRPVVRAFRIAGGNHIPVEWVIDPDR
jgi:proteasome lid subunit RPN8/RPN11